MEKHLHVWTDVITAGDDKFAAMNNAGHRLWTEAEWERMSNWTREIYSGFIEKVATCRHLEFEHVDAELAQGRIWHGAESVKMMNFSLKTRKFVSKTRNFVLKTRNFVLK